MRAWGSQNDPRPMPEETAVRMSNWGKSIITLYSTHQHDHPRCFPGAWNQHHSPSRLARAPQNAGSIAGTVLDPVRCRPRGRGSSQGATGQPSVEPSEGTGKYVLADLPPGTYDISPSPSPD